MKAMSMLIKTIYIIFKNLYSKLNSMNFMVFSIKLDAM